MTDDNKQIDVSEIYNNNMQFLNVYDNELYNKVRTLERQFAQDANAQKYDLKYNKTHFDVYHRGSNAFLYNQDSNAYSKNIVNQIAQDEINNNFKPYMPMHFDETFMHHLKNSNIMDNNFSAAAPVVDYVQKNGIEKRNNPNVHKFICFGIALGLHLQEIHNKFNCKLYLIGEPDLELFRLSLFVVSYNQIAKKADLVFSIADSEMQFQAKCEIFLKHKYILNYNIKYNLFSLRAAHLIKIFQSVVTAQSFITFAYPRRFMACERPLKLTLDKFNFLDVSTNDNRVSTLSNHRVLVLASGPSLMNNIQWLIDNQNKFIIITVAANLRILNKYAVKPDIIISIDSDRDANIKTLDGVDMDFFSESMVIISDITHPDIIKKYAKNDTFIIQSIATYHNDLFKLFGVSVGEVVYAFSLIYGGKNIYLLGLNFALDPDTNQSHAQGHIMNTQHQGITDGHKHDELDLHKNYLTVKGNFREKIFTTTVLYVSISEFNLFTQAVKTKDVNVYNLSDGAYLNDTIPLEIQSVNTNEFSILSKDEIKGELREDFLKNSRSKLSEHDKKIIKRKIKNAKNIKQLIKLQMAKTNYKETKVFLKDIEELVNKIGVPTSKTDSIELNQILFEYTRLVSHYVYEICEQTSFVPNALEYVESMNKIFTTQLLKITDKFIDTVQEFSNKV